MKIQLDTDNKTITIESNVKIGEFIDVVSKLLPEDVWKEYTILTDMNTNWGIQPIIIKYIEKDPYYPYWWSPLAWCNADTTTRLEDKSEDSTTSPVYFSHKVEYEL